MPLSSSLVGLESTPYVADIDDRWAMNYAASIDDSNPRLYDTRHGALPVHPMYLAHPEWEATKLLMPTLGLTDEEAGTSVEMSHDTIMRRPLVSGVRLSTVAKVAGVERHRSGAMITYELVTSIDGGDEVGSTRVWALFRGVEVDGEDRPAPGIAAADHQLNEQVSTVQMPISATACHTYSECARIWNAFHTDIKVAEATGISGLILHGTATLAKAASALSSVIPAMDIENVTRISADLRAMVFAPSQTELRFNEPREAADGSFTVAFELITEDGGRALTRGAVSYHPQFTGDITEEGSR